MVCNLEYYISEFLEYGDKSADCTFVSHCTLLAFCSTFDMRKLTISMRSLLGDTKQVEPILGPRIQDH